MTTANNVIIFPSKNNRYNGPTSIEEIDETMDLVKQFHIQETIETVIPTLFDQLTVAGFAPDEDDDEVMKHSAMVVESIRSLLCLIRGIDHPLQMIADNLFIHTEDGLAVSDKVKIIITPKEGKSE
jgi:hypothetical protein